MSAGWVASTVRARALTRRRLGSDGVRRLAGSTSLAGGIALLAGSAYSRDLAPDMTPDLARRAVAAVGLWHLRVLAGWLPPRGPALLRALAAWYEARNISDRLDVLAGRPAESPYRMGALATSWGRLSGASTATELRRALATSPWGDPGPVPTPQAGVALGMAWARRLAEELPAAGTWAAGRAALLVAVAVCDGTPLAAGPASDARRLLGDGWRDARTVPELAAALPRRAAWVLDGVTAGDGLWRAEPVWWRRVAEDGAALTLTPRPGPDPVVGVAATLLADAWRAGAALEIAARGGDRELADALG